MFKHNRVIWKIDKGKCFYKFRPEILKDAPEKQPISTKWFFFRGFFKKLNQTTSLHTNKPQFSDHEPQNQFFQLFASLSKNYPYDCGADFG